MMLNKIINKISNPSAFFRFGSIKKRNFYYESIKKIRYNIYKKRLLSNYSENLNNDSLKIIERDGYLKSNKYNNISLVSDAVSYCQTKIDNYLNNAENVNGHKKYLVSLPFDNKDIRNPLLKLALSNFVVSAASQYLGIVPVLSNIQIWYSPNNIIEDNAGSQLFHLDYADVKQCKLFIPIKCIDEISGPLTFIPAEISKKIAREISYRHTSNENRIEDGVIESFITKDKWLKATGEKGDMIFIDTCNCFHYGSRRAIKPRSILMIQFVSPFSFIYPWDFESTANYSHLIKSSKDPITQLLLGKK